jgi:hypothetical protein
MRDVIKTMHTGKLNSLKCIRKRRLKRKDVKYPSQEVIGVWWSGSRGRTPI